MSGQSVVGKLASFATQYVLAWLLVPKDFGIVSLANTVALVCSLCTQMGVREFLVSRQRDEWLEPAIWLALTLSLLSASLMILCSPVAARAYHEPRIAGLIIVLACGQPFSALSAVLGAKLQRQMRFRVISAIGTAMAILNAAIGIGCAKIGFGPYSFVIPVTLTAVVQLPLTWRAAGFRLTWRPNPRLWKYFLATATYTFLTNVGFVVGGQVDYAILGIFNAASAVGVYYFAFSLSTQVNRLFWGSFTNVLFPALGQIRDDKARLRETFQRIAAIVSVVFVPMCFLQAATARPLIALLFPARWAIGVPIVQVLSIGLGLHTIAEPCIALLQAQRKFHTLLLLTTVWALAFTAVVYVAASHGTVFNVAVAVSAFYAIFSPIYFYVVVRDFEIRWFQVCRIYGSTALVSGVAAAAPALFCAWLDVGELPSLVITVSLFACIYRILIGLVAPQEWVAARDILRPVLHRLARVTQ